MSHWFPLLADHLVNNGWVVTCNDQNCAFTAIKTMKFDSLAGTISNGTRNVVLDMSENGRWFSIVDGWNNVIKDLDLRECTTYTEEELVSELLAAYEGE